MDYSKASQMLKFQQEAMKIKKELENTLIESEVDGFVVTINGEMKAEKAEFETDVLVPGLNSEQKKALEKAIVEAINKGIKKSQEYAAEKMQGIMGQMGMGDLMNQLGGGMK
ncbi:YbaB/EbfC family DNA-binding protein [Candidatus Gracilibacteria bacterium]|nr:YbaB/EbfC family nucleoid-associated protein [Candidatus Gracilibacteria bacterium]MBF0913787.1 YbaB/EbfC family nucleoid-associated protein [Candidatus Gracilibacteria bacterium]RKW22204.1 MAG: YbaB/EbfC family DNA-binding protein [Candidatus Gracilibacteria bacterium]